MDDVDQSPPACSKTEDKIAWSQHSKNASLDHGWLTLKTHAPFTALRWTLYNRLSISLAEFKPHLHTALSCNGR